MVSAAQVTDLYQGKAPTSGDMTAAQSQALGEVLVKVTGRRDILTQPEVAKALVAQGMTPAHSTPQELSRLMAVDSKRWAALIKAQNIKAE